MAEGKYTHFQCVRMGHSRQFFELMRALGEAKSRQEEDIIIEREINVLKASMKQPKVAERQMKEYAIRLLYCEMVGHSADFGYVHAINLSSQSTMSGWKRAGYLVVSQSVAPDSELLLLAVAGIRKDLAGSSFVDIASALCCAAKVLSAELIVPVIKDVQKCLKHNSHLVRKHAVNCVHAFWRRAPEAVGDLQQYRQLISDKDPSVMGCALSFWHDVAQRDPEECTGLVKPHVDILQQILDHRLQREYDYDRIPAPWMQIRILKTLALLCKGSKENSQMVYAVLADCMKRADSGNNIGFAIVSECVRTITSIHPSTGLIESATEATGKFVTSLNPNVKYFGIVALSSLVHLTARCAANHQHIVITCLEDSDESIRRRTLLLLYAMTNERNVEVVGDRLVKFLAAAQDTQLREELSANICDLATEYSPSREWYVATLVKVFRLADEHVSDEMVQKVLRTVAEGDESQSDEEHRAFQVHCVRTLAGLFEAKHAAHRYPGRRLQQLAAWIIGEYGYLAAEGEGTPIAHLLAVLRGMFEAADGEDTRNTIVTAMMKLCARADAVPQDVQRAIGLYAPHARDVSLHQRCYEFLAIADDCKTLSEVLPADSCCEELRVDPSLAFMDAMVKQSLAEGMPPYTPRDLDRIGRAPTPEPAEAEEPESEPAVSVLEQAAARPATSSPPPAWASSAFGGAPVVCSAEADADAAAKLGKADSQFAKDLFADPEQRRAERLARQKRKEERDRKRLEKEARRVAKEKAAEARAAKAVAAQPPGSAKAAGGAEPKRPAPSGDIFASIFSDAAASAPDDAPAIRAASEGLVFSSKEVVVSDQWTTLSSCRAHAPDGVHVMWVLESKAALPQVRITVKAPAKITARIAAFPQEQVVAERQGSVTFGPGTAPGSPVVLRALLVPGGDGFGATLACDCCYALQGAAPMTLAARQRLSIADFTRNDPEVATQEHFASRWVSHAAEVAGAATVRVPPVCFDFVISQADALLALGKVDEVDPTPGTFRAAAQIAGIGGSVLAMFSVKRDRVEFKVRSKSALTSRQVAEELQKKLLVLDA